MKKLLIVQNIPTQFDVPLYNCIADRKPFDLTVIYTQTHGPQLNFDPEIGRSPGWDHIERENYHRIDLSKVQATNTRKTVDVILDNRPDHVLISGYFPRLHRALVPVLQDRGVSVGLRSDNTLQHSNFNGLRGIIKKIMLPGWLRRYDSWHPVGTLAREYLVAVAGMIKPVFSFPYAVDNSWFAGLAACARDSRLGTLAELGFPEDAFVVLAILKWHPREDPLTLIEGFSLFAEEEPRARLVLVGDGPMRDEVRARIAGFKHLVHTPGYVNYSALPGLYALADIFVHPAPGEPWGVSVNEALACGVPVIASSGVGAGRDLIIEGSTGAVFPAGDGAALAACLRKLVRQVSAEQRQACRDRVAGWGYDTTIETFTQLLQSLEN